MATLLRSVAVVLFAAIAAPAISFAADGPKIVPIPVANVAHPGQVDFESEILPFFSTSCLACHNKSKPKGGLVLETPATIKKGGDDGPVIKPGKSAESLLLKAASHAPEVDAPMPPPNNKVAAPDLTPEQLGLIKLWIDQGATGEVRGTLAPVKWQAMPTILDPIFAVSISADGRFAACGRANRIDVYDLPAGKLSAHLLDPQLQSSGPLSAHQDMVESLAFSPDGTTLASGSYREVKLWRRSSDGQKVAIGDKAATCVTTSADGKLIATGTEDGVIRLWDGATFKSTGEMTGHSAAIVSLQFKADGSKLLSVSKDKSVRIWETSVAKLFCKVEPPGEVRCAAWMGGKTIVTGSTNGAVSIYNLPPSADGEMTVNKSFKDPAAAVTGIVSLNDDAHLLASREDGGVYRISIGSGTMRPLFKQGTPITSLAIRADSKRVLTAGSDNIVRVWTVEDGKMIAELKGDPILAARAATADRALVLATNEVKYRKTHIDSAQDRAKAAVDRAQKAKDALPAAEKALADAQKAFDATKAASDDADKATKDKKEVAAKELAKADDDLKKAKDARAAASDAAPKTKEAVTTAERELAAAQAAFDAAKSAKNTADSAGGNQTDEKKAKVADEFAKAEAKLKQAKEAQAAAADARLKAKDAIVQAEKSVTDAQRRSDAAKTARDAADNAKDGKQDAAAKELATAEDALRKAKNARTAADDEIKLSTRAVDDYAVALTDAKAAAEAADQRLKLREKEAADAKKAIGESAKPIRAVAFSPDGALIATAGDDGAVHTWSSEKGTAGEVFGHESKAIGAVAFVGSSQLVICPTGAPPAVLTPSSNWTLARTIGGGEPTSPFADRVTSIDFSPDGKSFVTGGGIPSRSGEIRIFDAETGSLKQAFDDVHTDTVFCVRFSPEGSRLASAGADRFVRILNLSTGKVVRALEGHAGHALSVAWSHDGHLLASGGADNTLRFWDAETGERGKIVAGFEKEVTGVTFVGDENQVVGTSGEGKVRLVRADGGDVRSFPGAADFMYSVSTTPDGGTLIAGGQDGILREWNAVSGAPTGTFSAAGGK